MLSNNNNQGGSGNLNPNRNSQGNPGINIYSEIKKLF